MTPPSPSAPRPRRRIINAALELVAEGGYDALQVRALSERAGVSSRTVYTHFPSLDSLLIVAVSEQSQELYRRHTDSPPTGKTAALRVRKLIAELTETMTENPTVTAALLRALLSGKPDVAPWVRAFGEVLRTMLASAIAPDGPTAHDEESAELLECIWFSTLIGWSTGADDEGHIDDVMKKAALALLGPN